MADGRWTARVAVPPERVAKCGACGQEVVYIQGAKKPRAYNVFLVNGAKYRKRTGAAGGVHHCAAWGRKW